MLDFISQLSLSKYKSNEWQTKICFTSKENRDSYVSDINAKIMREHGILLAQILFLYRKIRVREKPHYRILYAVYTDIDTLNKASTKTNGKLWT